MLRALDEVGAGGARTALTGASAQTTTVDVFTEALGDLGCDQPTLFGERMEEFAYLANVLVAGHDRDGVRLRPKQAADAAIATVCYGAVIEVRARRPKASRQVPPTAPEFIEILQQRGADLLFRVGSSARSANAAPGVKSARKSGVLYSSEQLEIAIRRASASKVQCPWFSTDQCSDQTCRQPDLHYATMSARAPPITIGIPGAEGEQAMVLGDGPRNGRHTVRLGGRIGA